MLLQIFGVDYLTVFFSFFLFYITKLYNKFFVVYSHPEISEQCLSHFLIYSVLVVFFRRRVDTNTHYIDVGSWLFSLEACRYLFLVINRLTLIVVIESYSNSFNIVCLIGTKGSNTFKEYLTPFCHCRNKDSAKSRNIEISCFTEAERTTGSIIILTCHTTRTHKSIVRTICIILLIVHSLSVEVRYLYVIQFSVIHAFLNVFKHWLIYICSIPVLVVIRETTFNILSEFKEVSKVSLIHTTDFNAHCNRLARIFNCIERVLN